ncbi:MAG: hypothetical protein JO199_12030 [Candidatus Eremiobacteraeota bacterium]|nr:hypothetical protein [Candidatus Eremiobacteraeota bacterium]
MRSLHAVYQLARADFLERARTFGYLATIGITLWLGSLCAPASSANYVIFSIDHYRGFYNSAWMGVVFTVLITTWLSLIGFYLVKSAVTRDRSTRVGEIIAATSVGKFEYILGKTLSNFAVLATIVAVLALDAIAMQLMRGENRSVDLVALLAPIALFALPLMTFISAIAVLFEVLPVLRGGIGNIVYFFLWLFLLSTSDLGSQLGTKRPVLDAFGMGTLSNGAWEALKRVDPNRRPTEIGLIVGGSHHAAKLFHYDGMQFGMGVYAQRLSLVVLAFLVVVIAALVFDRFASASRTRERREPALVAGARATFERISTPILDLLFASSFGSLVLAELRLLLSGASFWWYAVAGGFWIWTLFAPGAMQSFALGFAWVWAILMWSPMGTRETVNQTEQFVYPTLRPLRRQFSALLCAGVLLALALGSGSMLHAFFAHDPHAIAGVLAGALFIPSLALACGAASGTTRVFEIVYLMLWYVGPMNATPLDYTNAANAPAFAVAAAVLIALAFLARRTRLALA